MRQLWHVWRIHDFSLIYACRYRNTNQLAQYIDSCKYLKICSYIYKYIYIYNSVFSGNIFLDLSRYPCWLSSHASRGFKKNCFERETSQQQNVNFCSEICTYTEGSKHKKNAKNEDIEESCALVLDNFYLYPPLPSLKSSLFALGSSLLLSWYLVNRGN